MSDGENEFRWKRVNILKAKRGLSTPVSLSFLMFSFIILIVTTYAFANSSINTKLGSIKVVAANEAMLAVDRNLRSIAWTPGSSIIQTLYETGGTFRTQPSQHTVLVNISIGDVHEVVFNSATGRIQYDLPASESNPTNIYLRGDARSIINHSFADQAQLYTTYGNRSQELRLHYRPLVSTSIDAANTSVNVLRIYLINLNATSRLHYQGATRLRLSTLNVTVQTHNYAVAENVSTAIVEAIIYDRADQVFLPLVSSNNTTLIRVELFICYLTLEEVTL
jgi:hypothetical protein